MDDNNGEDHQGTWQKLRKGAQALLRSPPKDVSSMTRDEIQRLVEELQIHHIELELQNEQLKKSVVEAARARDRFRDLYDSAPFGYLTLDRHGLIVEANDTIVGMLAMERARMLRSKFTDLVAFHSQDSFYLWWHKVLSGSAVEPCGLQLSGPGGLDLQVSLQLGEFDDFGSSPDHYHVALVDVGALKRSEEALRTLNITLEDRISAQVEETKLLANATANLGEGVMITDGHENWPESRIVFANEAMCAISGYTLEQLLERKPAILFDPEYSTDRLNQLARALVTDHFYKGEEVCRRNDGQVRDIELLINPITDDAGDVTHFVSVQRDITARKKTRLELKNREDLMRALLDTAQDAIITIDAQGIVQDCNAAVKQLFGYEPGELLGRNISMLIPEPHRSKHDAYLRRYRETREPHIVGSQRELVALHANGSRFPVSLSVNEIDHRGLFVGFIRDMSAERTLQRQLLQAASEEQTRIGQALHDGPQQELAGLSLKAASMAMELEHASSPHAARVRAFSEGLKQANHHVRYLAQGLVPVQTESLGLMGALDQLADRVSDSSGLTCRLRYSETVHVDDPRLAEQLYYIAQEAVTNAVKHAAADNIDIHLEQFADELQLRVTDNGRGIPAGTPGGQGLGLAIMRYRSALIGAELIIAGAEGGGTTVSCSVSDLMHETDGRPLTAGD